MKVKQIISQLKALHIPITLDHRDLFKYKQEDEPFVIVNNANNCIVSLKHRRQRLRDGL